MLCKSSRNATNGPQTIDDMWPSIHLKVPINVVLKTMAYYRPSISQILHLKPNTSISVLTLKQIALFKVYL